MKLQAPAVLKNKYVLYVLLVLAIINVLGYVGLQDYDSLALFVAVGVLSTYFSKNMAVNLLLAIVVTSLIAIIFSGISCFYYIRLIKIFFFQKSIQKIWLFNVSKELDICLIVSSSIYSFFLVFPETLILLSSYISL